MRRRIASSDLKWVDPKKSKSRSLKFRFYIPDRSYSIELKHMLLWDICRMSFGE